MMDVTSGRSDGGGWRIGQLAEMTGLTVRTLRHYAQIGLLHPAGETMGGHRLYDRENVGRLYRILTLRELGFSLSEIHALLDDPGWDLAAMVERHAEATERALASSARLSVRLRAISGEIARTQETSPEVLFGLIEDMSVSHPPIRGTTSLLVYDDVARAHTYLRETLGLVAGALELDADGRAVHGEVYAGDQAIWLHPRGDGHRSPRELGAVSAMVVIAVEAVDAHFERSRERGADVLGPPVDQPYGVREYGVRDVEGHLWYFHGPLE